MLESCVSNLKIKSTRQGSIINNLAAALEKCDSTISNMTEKIERILRQVEKSEISAAVICEKVDLVNSETKREMQTHLLTKLELAE